MGTTLTKKEGVKSSVRTKKVAPIKRTLKKAPPKETSTSKTKTRPATKQSTRKTQKTKLSDSGTSEVVFVPTTASLRLLEKVHLYTIWYERNVPQAMSTVAKVGGYTFILLGTLFAVSSYIDTRGILSTPAALVCSELECVDVADEDLAPAAPKISFLNSLPSIISVDTDFKISLENSTNLSVSIVAVETGEVILIEPHNQSDNSEYIFIIPGSRLLPGSYIIKASTDKDRVSYTFTGPDFRVIEKDLPLSVSAPIVAEVLESQIQAELLDSTSDDNEVSSDATVSNSEEVPEIIESQGNDSDRFSPITSNSEAPILVSLNIKDTAEYLTVSTGDFTPTKVAVYSQVNAVGQPLYLGQATFVQGEWFFSVSALALPEANHYLYVSFEVNDVTYKSEAVRYIPTPSIATSPATEADLAILVQKIEIALLASSINNDNRRRYFGYFSSKPESLFDINFEIQFAEPGLLSAIDTAMRNDGELLEPLLLRYASAVQGESEFLITLTSKALTEHYTRLASSVAATIGQPEAVPSIHTVLALRYQVLKDNIRDAEEQVRQESNGLTARDSDQDGISDFDEIVNFGTSALFSDTDNDGVIDSVELVRGSSLLNPDLKTIPELNKNIEEVTFGELVEINFIAPQVNGSKGTEDSEYHVSIQGTSVPNSYVYILSYSTGAVGVVKTSASGSFSYTIERDFDIGEHEIAAVVTDAMGNIVASSKTHRFARTEDSFVAASSVSSQAGLVIHPTQDKILLNILVASVGVITFGFVLLLLSNTVRGRRQQKPQLA